MTQKPRIFTLSNRWGTAEIAAHGAHLLSCTMADGKPLLWCESSPSLTDGYAIHGGIPICWPWFGLHLTDPDHQPMHGTVQQFDWECTAQENGDTESRLVMEGDFYGSRLRMEYCMTDALDLEFSFTNRTDRTLRYSAGFHSYFAVGHICRTAIRGLAGLQYLARPEDIYYPQQDDVTFNGTDVLTRIYETGVTGATIIDTEWQRQIRITPRHTDAMVVWNPGVDAWRRFNAFKPGDDKAFVCVETVIPRGFERDLAPGATGMLGTRIEIAGL